MSVFFRRAGISCVIADFMRFFELIVVMTNYEYGRPLIIVYYSRIFVVDDFIHIAVVFFRVPLGSPMPNSDCLVHNYAINLVRYC